jgi:hypothetical protein
MSTTAPPPTLVIAAPCAADVEAALQIAMALGPAAPAHFAGVLVEGADPRGSGMIAAQRIVTDTGLLRPVPSQRDRRIRMAADARAFEAALRTAAGQAGAGWRMSRGTGDLISCARQAARAGDMLLLGYKPWQKRPGRVLCICADPSGECGAGHLGRTIARTLARAFELLPAAVESGAFLQDLERRHAALLVIDPAVAEGLSERTMTLLLSAARCPILLPGA